MFLKYYQKIDDAVSYLFSSVSNEKKLIQNIFKKKNIVYVDIGINEGNFLDCGGGIIGGAGGSGTAGRLAGPEISSPARRFASTLREPECIQPGRSCGAQAWSDAGSTPRV